VNEDIETRETAESGDQPIPADDDVVAKQLFEAMLDSEVPMPEEAGYGHGV
jgi:hypothetical protein